MLARRTSGNVSAFFGRINRCKGYFWRHRKNIIDAKSYVEARAAHGPSKSCFWKGIGEHETILKVAELVLRKGLRNEPKGTKSEPKGSQREPLGGETVPKVSERATKIHQKIRPSEKVAKRRVPVSRAGPLFGLPNS